MNRLLCALLCSLSTTPYLLTNTQEADTRSAQIEQEIADFDTYVNDHIDTIADDTGIIRVTIMIYKDQSAHNKETWKNVITKTAQSCNRLRSYDLDGSPEINIEQELQTIIHDLVDSQRDNGITTEFTIQTSDGMPTKGCCGNDCQCIQRYRGNCPCSMDSSLNRCLFPQEELPFDDQYDQNDQSNDNDAVEESSSDDEVDVFEEVNLKSKKTCCK